MLATAIPFNAPADLALRRMIVAADLAINPLTALAMAAAVADGSGRDAQTSLLATRLAGRTVQATVLQKLADGSATVDIDGATVHVAAQVPEPGRTVILRFAATMPETHSKAAMSAPPPTEVNVGKLAHALSDVARLPPGPLALGRIDADPAIPRQFAAALATAVRDSGMFYEAHLARWSRGQYPLELLQREPQAVLTPTTAGPSERPEARDHGGQAQPTALAPGRAEPGIPAQHAGPDQHLHEAPQSVQSEPLQPVLHEALQPVLREQLQILESRSLALMLEAWPGQTARLDIIEEDGAGERAPTATDAARWTTRLRLTLPALGRVDADMSLCGTRLDLTIRTDSASHARLASGATALAGALAAAGITLAACKVVDHVA